MRLTNFQDMCCSYFLELLCNISRVLYNQYLPQLMQFEKLSPAVTHMHNHYQANLRITDYADLCGMSYSEFIRRFRSNFGLSPLAYLTTIRMKSASELLLSTKQPISDIAYKVGYKNPLYFSRLFKKYSGSSPVEYRNFHKNPSAFPNTPHETWQPMKS